MPIDHDRLAFFKSFAACPEDDTPRLVYADWLQERGEDERAELIRVMIEADRRNSAADDSLYLRRYSLCMWFWEWFYKTDVDDRCGGKLERGMLKSVICDWDWWFRHGDRVSEAEWVPLVRLSTPPEFRVSDRQRVDEERRIQIITRKVVAAGKVASCEVAISEIEYQTADYDVLAVAMERLDRQLTPKRVLSLWWPLTTFEGAGLEDSR